MLILFSVHLFSLFSLIKGPQMVVTAPSDPEIVAIIEVIATFVVQDGHQLEVRFSFFFSFLFLTAIAAINHGEREGKPQVFFLVSSW